MHRRHTRATRKGKSVSREGRSAMPVEKVRVAICDDHELFGRGIAEMPSLTGDIEIIAEAATHDEAMAVVSEHGP